MKSFGILRTNPGLTTNVKVVVDSKYGLSLDSINSVPDLANTRFKKFEFNKDNYFDELLPYFFDGLPSELAFSVKYDDDSDTMSTNFADQFDEIYQYGARNILENKNYEEEYEYFAPLYVYKNKLPKNFVIFRVDGPGITSINKSNFKSQIISKMKTVKIFDLTKSSLLGEWLDLNIDDNEFYPDTPLEMNYQRLEFSKWNGIDYRSGGFISKSFFMDDVLEKEMEVFEMEKLIFDGYRKNGVVFPNILNMSFLFDDTPADKETLRKWSINRYFGFYLDEMDKVASLSPYVPPVLKSGIEILSDNILSHPDGVPFVDGWSDANTYYVEHKGEYYKVEKFTIKAAKSVKPVLNSTAEKKAKTKAFPSKSGAVQISTASLVDVNNPSTGNYVKDEKTDTYVDKWRIISPIDLSGKHAELNKNSGFLDEDMVIVDYQNNYKSIDDFDRADVWIIEIDGKYHNLVRDGIKIKVVSDYYFEFGNDFYRYYVNNLDPNYTKTVFIRVDENTAPISFPIYRLKFSDIKDFDTRVVDTEPSKFEYEKEFELTNTEESKLYLQNLNSQTFPKQFDDFYLGGNVVKIPVSSEYTANNETFKINGGVLSPIWRKNPVYCRWGFEGSNSANDYPYILNNSSTFEDHNRTANTFETRPVRVERNLDYFYTINSSSSEYLHHSLHVQKSDVNGIDPNFDFRHDRYLGLGSVISGTGISQRLDFDYFDSIFKLKTSFNSNKLIKNTKKFSEFVKGDGTTPNYTVFRGIKFSIYDVKNIKLKSTGQIEVINTITRNTFEDYKFSILLTSLDNGMQWDVIDKWEMRNSYKKGDLVEHNDIIFRALRDTVCKTPRINAVVANPEYGISVLKPGPHNLLGYTNTSTFPLSELRFDTSVTTGVGSLAIDYTDSNPGNSNDWEYYNEIQDANIGHVFWDPLKAYKKQYKEGDIVYNNGNFYVFSNAGGTVDFWNPIAAFINTEMELINTGKVRKGYGKDVIVFFMGSFYKSLVSGNLQTPDSSNWAKISDLYSSLKWVPAGIWTPNRQYGGDGKDTYLLHRDVLYRSTNKNKQIPSGEQPDKSSMWTRIYSMVPDTELVYSRTKNPIIHQNGEYYRIVTNVGGSTLDNGIRIFINHKFKNVLVNIYVNDNTMQNLKNSDRDSLYTSLSGKLVAKNFIDCINNPMLKNGFSDYISYHVISVNGEHKTYSFDNNITNQPHIIFAERPDLLKVKSNTLITLEKNENKLKASKYLNDGRINSPDQLNYYNNTHVAAEIVENVEREDIYDKYYNLHNKIFRFSGNYMPVFYDLELFNTDNSVEYNRLELMLELSSSQNVRFDFDYNGIQYERIYTINPSGSYSTSLEYHSQLLTKICDEFPTIDFKSEILPKAKNVQEGEVLSLMDDSFDAKDSKWYDRSKTETIARIISATSSPSYSRSELYPGNYFRFKGGPQLISLMYVDKVPLNSNNMTFEFVIKSTDVSNYNIFSGDGLYTWFGFEDGRVFMKNKFDNNSDSAVYSNSVLIPNVWYHITFTISYNSKINKSDIKVYIDGTDLTSDESLSLTHTFNPYVSSFALYAPSTQTGNVIYFGYKSDYSTNAKPYSGIFNGNISSIRFFERTLTDKDIRANFVALHQTLSVKYKSEHGLIKLALRTDEPRLYMDFYDSLDPAYNFYSIQLGATGGNPPYMYSVNGSAFSTNTSYTTIAKGTTMYIIVEDYLGLTSSTGTYLVNTNTDTPYKFTSPYAY